MTHIDRIAHATSDSIGEDCQRVTSVALPDRDASIEEWSQRFDRKIMCRKHHHAFSAIDRKIDGQQQCSYTSLAFDAVL
jgi:hypothetical protein